MSDDEATANNESRPAVGAPVEPPVRPWGTRLDLDAQPVGYDRRQGDILRWREPQVGALYDQAAIDALLALLKRCRPIIEADAQMMEDISRHAPLDADSQAKHDATEYESEKLARELDRLLGPNAKLTCPPRGQQE